MHHSRGRTGAAGQEHWSDCGRRRQSARHRFHHPGHERLRQMFDPAPRGDPGERTSRISALMAVRRWKKWLLFPLALVAGYVAVVYALGVRQSGKNEARPAAVILVFGAAQ